MFFREIDSQSVIWSAVPTHVPSVRRATARVSDPQMSQLTAPLLYEQVPVQYGSHADHTPHTHTRTHKIKVSKIALHTSHFQIYTWWAMKYKRPEGRRPLAKNLTRRSHKLCTKQNLKSPQRISAPFNYYFNNNVFKTKIQTILKHMHLLITIYLSCNSLDLSTVI